MNYGLLESRVRRQNVEQLKTFAMVSRSLKLSTSHTYYDSTMNPTIDQFIVIHGIIGLCGIMSSIKCVQALYDSAISHVYLLPSGVVKQTNIYFTLCVPVGCFQFD